MPSNIELERIVKEVVLTNLDKDVPLGWDGEYNLKSWKTTTDDREVMDLVEAYSRDRNRR